MKCPYCDKKGKGRVIDTRPCEEGRVIRRRRECLGCHSRWSTLERVETAKVQQAEPVATPPSKKVQVREFMGRLRAAQRKAREI